MLQCSSTRPSPLLLPIGSLRPLSALDIKAPKRTEYTSNLVKLAIEADGMAVSEDNPVQLFWGGHL